MLKDSSSLDNPEYYCNNSNYEENVNNTSQVVSDKTYCPGNYQDYSNYV